MLLEDEICPGLTFKQHAESLAMFRLNQLNKNYDSVDLAIETINELSKLQRGLDQL